MAFVLPEAKDPRLKIKVAHEVTVEMIAKLEDGTLEPHAPAAPPDAGVPLARRLRRRSPPAREPDADAHRPAPTAPAPTAQVQKAKLLVRALASRKPVAATLSVRGASSQTGDAEEGSAGAPGGGAGSGQLHGGRLAPGFLAQTRQVELSGGAAQPLDFSLVRAPKKKLVTEKGDRFELLQAAALPRGQADAAARRRRVPPGARGHARAAPHPAPPHRGPHRQPGGRGRQRAPAALRGPRPRAGGAARAGGSGALAHRDGGPRRHPPEGPQLHAARTGISTAAWSSSSSSADAPLPQKTVRERTFTPIAGPRQYVY